ncbi:helix-turn-helix transcriptional regulator [Paenibacillus sp.]|uniref:helix-turn-helix transcriptional regulator n=1 Tax=Paenibacillus sp. TaxID=58172 RepID=UPI002810DF37|nr:helix-turn-helix transcriptional regulator [Paenibacillus sp.]
MRRAELGDFLRTRRERLAPDDVGLPAGQGARRRAKGLRREEVAALAGISLPWYTSLEQGKDIRVSEQVLESLARTLRLSRDERVHLFLLADQRMPARIAEEAYDDIDAHALKPVLDRLDPFPAYVMDRRMNVVAWNRPAELLFGGFDAAGDGGRERNLLWLMFTKEEFKTRFGHWEQMAKDLTARFRTYYAKHIEDPWYQETVAALAASSAEFADWWTEHSVLCLRNGPDVAAHPESGHVKMVAHAFILADREDAVMTVYTPAPTEAVPEGMRCIEAVPEPAR